MTVMHVRGPFDFMLKTSHPHYGEKMLRGNSCEKKAISIRGNHT